MFKLTVLKVVTHEGSKMFLPFPSIGAIACLVGVQTKNGILHHSVGVARFSSYNNSGREVDTAVIVYRKGEFFSQGSLDYLGGQSDGYLAVSGLGVPVLHGAKPIEIGNPHSLSADDFEEGDEVVFVCRDK